MVTPSSVLSLAYGTTCFGKPQFAVLRKKNLDKTGMPAELSLFLPR